MKIRDKNEILESALKIVSLEGIEALTLSSLAAKVGLSKGSLYHYFTSKEEIISSSFDYAHSKMMEENFHITLKEGLEKSLSVLLAKWENLFSTSLFFNYVRVVLTLRFSYGKAEDEYRRISMMVKSQISVVLDSFGHKESFLKELFSSHILLCLFSIAEGESIDTEQILSSFLSLYIE